MNDTQQELQQRSLRNVRALLDKEEEEARRLKKGTRVLLFMFIPAIVLALVVVIWGVPGRSKPGPGVDPDGLKCLTRTWADKSGQREREIRSQNPDISPSEVGRRLQAENAAIKAAAAKECGTTLPSG